MDVHLRKRIGRQEDLVATWQLVRWGWTDERVRHWSRKEGWRGVHDGVWALGGAPMTQRRLWIAAILTAPGSHLGEFSAASCHGFYEWKGDYVTVVRPGSGGRRRYPGLLVARSSALEGHTTVRDGISTISAPRALIDISSRLRPWEQGRAFRESIRLKTTTADEIAKTCLALRGRRGTASLATLGDRYATVPYHRCKSDPEGRALEILHDAEVRPPQVNVRVAGKEADLVWRSSKFLVEIDSKEYHQFADQDAAKQALWEAAGYTVERIWANDVYFRPQLLLALVNGHIPLP